MSLEIAHAHILAATNNRVCRSQRHDLATRSEGSLESISVGAEAATTRGQRAANRLPRRRGTRDLALDESQIDAANARRFAGAEHAALACCLSLVDHDATGRNVAAEQPRDLRVRDK